MRARFTLPVDASGAIEAPLRAGSNPGEPARLTLRLRLRRFFDPAGHRGTTSEPLSSTHSRAFGVAGSPSSSDSSSESIKRFFVRVERCGRERCGRERWAGATPAPRPSSESSGSKSSSSSSASVSGASSPSSAPKIHMFYDMQGKSHTQHHTNTACRPWTTLPYTSATTHDSKRIVDNRAELQAGGIIQSHAHSTSDDPLA